MSVLHSLQVYWMSVFLIPATTIHEIEMLCRNFLWAQGDIAKGKCRIAWDVVCAPVRNGGLGLKRLGLWNRCFLFKHIWDILTHRDSLWVRWVQIHFIRGRNIWTIKRRNEWSWLFRNLMEIRPHCRRNFITSVGRGDATHAWEDTWSVQGHLSSIVTYRFLNGNGMDNTSRVEDIMNRFGVTWPQEWLDRFPALAIVSIPTPNDEDDRILWLGPNDVKQYYTVNVAMKTFQENVGIVHWHRIVWNIAYIPKHALCMWMACHRRLPTQDRLVQWKTEPPDLKCVLCKRTIETHDHLFFGCRFSNAIWKDVKNQIRLDDSPDLWSAILDSWLMGGGWRRWSTSQRVAISATVYHIWMERNRRYFDDCNQNEDQIVTTILMEVMMRMAWKTNRKQELARDNG